MNLKMWIRKNKIIESHTIFWKNYLPYISYPTFVHICTFTAFREKHISFSFFFFLLFKKLKYNWFTMLCQFLLNWSLFLNYGNGGLWWGSGMWLCEETWRGAILNFTYVKQWNLARWTPSMQDEGEEMNRDHWLGTMCES